MGYRFTYQKMIAMMAAATCWVSGASIADIAKQAGKSQATIRRWIKLTGVKRKEPQ